MAGKTPDLCVPSAPGQYGPLLGDVILTVSAGYTLKDVDFRHISFRGIYLTNCSLLLHGLLGIINWFSFDVTYAYGLVCTLQYQLYVAGLNVDLYLRNGYQKPIAYLHLLPSAVVLLAKLANKDVTQIEEIGVLANIISLIYIAFQINNKDLYWTTGVACTCQFFNWILKLFNLENIQFLTFTAIEIRKVLLSVYVILANKVQS